MPEEEWERLLDDYEKSGLTQAAFARREGINLHTLVGRLGRRRMRRREAVVAPAGIRFKELSLRSGSASVLEVHLPDGVVLKGGSPRDLAELARALRG